MNSVVDDDRTYWIVEGKSDKDMTDPTVLLKQEAALAWVNAVNIGPDVQQKWGCVLSSEFVIDSANLRASLLTGTQTLN